MEKEHVRFLMESSRISEAKSLVQDLILAGITSEREWVQFLVSLAGRLKGSDSIHESTVAVNCLKMALELTSSVGISQTVVSLLSVAHFDLGIAFAKSGRISEATQEFQVARMNPELPSGYPYLAEGLLKLGRVEEAIEVIKSAIDLDPDDPDSHFILGNVLSDAGRYRARAFCFNCQMMKKRKNMYLPLERVMNGTATPNNSTYVTFFLGM